MGYKLKIKSLRPAHRKLFCRGEKIILKRGGEYNIYSCLHATVGTRDLLAQMHATNVVLQLVAGGAPPVTLVTRKVFGLLVDKPDVTVQVLNLKKRECDRMDSRPDMRLSSY